MKSNINETKNYPSNLRRWLAASGFALLTIVLLFYFKFNKSTNIIEEGLSNISDFYTENLKPIFFQSEITNEDVFNFALYGNLPIDKENNKVIQIDNPSNDVEELGFEVKYAALNEKSDNYNRFIDYLKLNSRDQQELDSLLNSYKNDLYTSILYNEDNTIALDPNIAVLQKAVSFDLYQFAKSKYFGDIKHIYPIVYDSEENTKVHTLLSDVRKGEHSDLIFVTPDTIFSRKYSYDKAAILEKLKSLENNAIAKKEALENFKLKLELEKTHIARPNEKIEEPDLIYTLDSSYCRVSIPTHTYPSNYLSRVDSVLKNIPTFSFNYNYDLDSNQTMDIKILSTEDDSLVEMKFSFNLMNLDSLLKNSMKVINKQRYTDWEQFGLNMDSLAQSIELQLENKNFILQEKLIDSLDYKRKIEEYKEWQEKEDNNRP